MRRFLLWLLLLIAPVSAHAANCSFSTLTAGPPKVIVCTDTTATTWSVPCDWQNTSATIEVIAGGGSGAWTGGAFAGGGGQGAQYCKKGTLSITAGTSLPIQVGTGGAAPTSATAGNAGTDSFVKTVGSVDIVRAKPGNGAAFNTGAGGTGTQSGTGDTCNAGGVGGSGSSNIAGGGGGGAGGPGGVGGTGSGGSSIAGAGAGGGNGGGGNAGSPSISVGGVGGTAKDTTAGGAGGTSSANPGNGSHGSGGGGPNTNFTPQSGTGAGGNGVDWDSTHGSGGGAGAVIAQQTGGSAGLYGAASGGLSFSGTTTGSVMKAGAQGIIVVTYTPGACSGGGLGYFMGPFGANDNAKLRVAAGGE